MRRFGNLPFAFGIETADTLPGVRVADHMHAVPNDLTVVKSIHQNAVRAVLAAVDRACIPFRSTRRRNALRVETPGNVTRRRAADILAKYTANYRSLFLVNCALARFAEHDVVAVGVPSCDAAVVNDASHAPANLVLKVGEKHRPEKATNTDLHGIGDTFMHGDDFDIGKRQALKNACQIFLIARNSV
ncbi:hypothetical protein LJ361_18505 [Brucella sp. JSBI001]|nr:MULTISPECIES: hypothetical protein [Brucella]UZD69083.1 hypothetical protein LJ361_18505 [Brucella sp. JSBI001]